MLCFFNVARHDTTFLHSPVYCNFLAVAEPICQDPKCRLVAEPSPTGNEPLSDRQLVAEPSPAGDNCTNYFLTMAEPSANHPIAGWWLSRPQPALKP